MVKRAAWTAKILPVLLPGHGKEEIPDFLQPNAADRYEVPANTPEAAESLLRVLTRQPRDVPVFMHGRSNKTFPPVFGTDCPPRGISGRVRKLAYAYPDHMARHWLMLLLADRVDLWEHRLRRSWPVVLPAVAGGLLLRAIRRR